MVRSIQRTITSGLILLHYIATYLLERSWNVAGSFNIPRRATDQEDQAQGYLQCSAYNCIVYYCLSRTVACGLQSLHYILHVLAKCCVPGGNVAERRGGT